MRTHAGLALLAALPLALAASGCGLKGPLELPEKSESVIIRGPGAAAPATPAEAGAPAEAAAPAGGPAAAPAPTTTTIPAKPKEERPPPPPLPGGNPGTARGG